ncbi:branched-chain amino acid transport system II carrier protein [Lysinibacillus sp. MHQ-1]|nr:branched-chain amino acid transport system II carrier protein [Lysinibacillus sp. MHQ-1]
MARFFAIPRTATVPFVVGFEPYIQAQHVTLLLAVFSFIFFRHRLLFFR